MILQALHQLHTRLSADPANGLPPAGCSIQNITFRIVLHADGTVAAIEDARRESIELSRSGTERRRLRPIELAVPGQTKPSGQGINPCTLWDNLTYLCGYPQPDRNAVKAAKNRSRAPRCYEGSRRHHTNLFAHSPEPGLQAVSRYFERHSPEDLRPHVDRLPEDARVGNGVFQLVGQTSFVHDVYRTSSSALHSQGQPDEVLGQCLITGSFGPIARLNEPKIKTFDPKGCLLVSFNERAYESYGKDDSRHVGQGRNAPISTDAAFAYCNALNWLLSRSSRRMRVGDATAVFWTDQPTAAEELMPWMLGGAPESEDDSVRARVQAALERIARGTLPPDELGDPATNYYILGLSPNAARLSVRFWLSGTLGELIANLRKHFQHLAIVRQWDETNSKNPEPVAPSVYQLLRQTARDADGIPPLLGGALMRAILLGTRYPGALVNGVMNRIRIVEKKPAGEGSLDNVSYLRAAILKGWLIRNHRNTITAMLDETNTNPGYRLGRLFAVLEKTQQDALPGINATIRERFYSSASATPRAVFGRLLRTYQHHLAKLETGARINREKQAQEILAAIADFPAHLNLRDQAQFALGYYHQRKELFTRRDAAGPTAPSIA